MKNSNSLFFISSSQQIGLRKMLLMASQLSQKKIHSFCYLDSDFFEKNSAFTLEPLIFKKQWVFIDFSEKNFSQTKLGLFGQYLRDLKNVSSFHCLISTLHYDFWKQQAEQELTLHKANKVGKELSWQQKIDYLFAPAA